MPQRQRLLMIFLPLLLLSIAACDQESIPESAALTNPATETAEPIPAPDPVAQKTETQQPKPVQESSQSDLSQDLQTEGVDVSANTVKELEWEALIPEEWRPETLMEQYSADDMSDDDPRAQEILEKIQALSSQAPTVPALEGQRIKLPGFVVPLDMDARKIEQFLLVPYYGACIHVPPPPSNQTVHVVTRAGKAYPGQLFDTVWVTGTLRVEHMSSDIAESGYRLEDALVVPYQ